MTRRLVTLLTVAAAVAAVTVGIAAAQSARGAAGSAQQDIHVVTGPGPVEFLDFGQDGFGLGDRLAAVSQLLDEHGMHRVGTSYLDCWIASPRLQDQSPLDCTYVLKLRGSDITIQGIDPHGLSDVFFSVMGGTGQFVGASGQAELIDSATRTDIIITLHG